MKFINYPTSIFFALLLVFSFSSCSDDDDVVTPTSMMVGDWNITSLNYAGRSTNDGTTIRFSAVGRRFTYVLSFQDNPKTFTSSGGYTVDLSSYIQGDTIVQEVGFDDIVTSGTWDINNNELTMTVAGAVPGEPADVIFTDIDNFYMDFADMFGKSLGGADVTFTSGKINFRRKKVKL